jgi:DNA-binding transcriptional LysR family regulator
MPDDAVCPAAAGSVIASKPTFRYVDPERPASMDELRQLRIFSAIVEAGGITAAAQQLDINTSVVSRALALLEGRLGIRLATRTTRSFELTGEGQTYHERIQTLLLALKDADDEITQNTRAPIGTLRVGVPSEIGRKRIAPLIARFARQHPGLDIRLVLSDEGLDVIHDSLDVAIRIDLPTDIAVVARKLMSSERVVCASPAYIAKFGMPEAPVDLASHACIRLIRGQSLMDRWTFAENGAKREVRISGALATDNGEVMHDWALEGHGIALKARWDIEDDLLKGTLIECLMDYQCDTISLYAVYASRRYLSLRIRRFIDFLVDEFQSGSGIDRQ